jgi:hypothetical protein
VSLILFAIIAVGPVVTAQHESAVQKNDKAFLLRRYSMQVGDSFSLFVHLPEGYNADARTIYPVVYLLDANFYFDMFAPIVRKYAEVGMLPQLILVGIGYRDFSEMDSLRDRDFTYPKGTADSSFSISGGGEKFLAFLQREVIPDVESRFRTDTTKRVLAGHSLGGYFTSYALMRHLSSGTHPFRYYIAASPSLDYNRYWLLGQLKGLRAQDATRKKTGLYLTYGTLEDAEDADMPGHIKWAQIAGKIGVLVTPLHVQYKTELFSNLRHMDTPIPTFIKGLQLALYPD